MNKIILNIFVFLIAAITSLTSLAHDNLVVIPITGGDADLPQFRIVPTGVTTDANRGRLEYTADKNPAPQSIWGNVCDDGFDGSRSTPINAAANAVCQDIGYKAGVLDDNYQSTGGLGFSLDEVTCPYGADSLSDCTYITNHNCSAPEQIGVHCFNPKWVFVSDTSYSGNLVSAANSLNNGTTYTAADGLNAGDALCQSQAEAAGLLGDYKAWLSSITINAINRFTFPPVPTPYALVDGTIVADSLHKLISEALKSPIYLTQFNGGRRSTNVWTSTDQNGNHFSVDCSGWASSFSGFAARLGYAGTITTAWTSSVYGFCDVDRHLYCFQQ